jgi:hypothetical protein
LWAKAVDLAQIDPALQSVFKKEARLFHSDQGEGAVGLDLHGDVYVTVGAVVPAGNGAKHRQMTHAAAAKFRFLRPEKLSDGVKTVRRHDVLGFQVVIKDKQVRPTLPGGEWQGANGGHRT